MSQQAEQVIPPANAGEPAADTGHVPPRIPWGATWVLLVSAAAVINSIIIAATHGARGMFVTAVTLCLCCIAAMFDGWTQRIPNPLTYTAVLLGLLLNAFAAAAQSGQWNSASTWLGAPGMTSAALGFGVCGTLGLLASLSGAVHGGDVKLLAAVGALMGLEKTATIAFIGLGAALVYAAVNLAMVGRLTLVLQVAAHRMLELFYLRRFAMPTPAGSKATHVPMAIPLAIAVAAVAVMDMRLPTAGGNP